MSKIIDTIEPYVLRKDAKRLSGTWNRVVHFEIVAANEAAYLIERIQSLSKNAGKSFLTELTSAADIDKSQLILKAEADNPEDQEWLEGYYRSFGFERVDDDNTFMVREPQ